MKKPSIISTLIITLKEILGTKTITGDGDLERPESGVPDYTDAALTQRNVLNHQTIRCEKLSKEEVELKLSAIEFCMIAENNDEALKLYSDLINKSDEEDTYKSFFYSGRASIYSNLKNWDMAIEDYKRSLEFCPDNSSTYINIGANITWKYFQSGDYRIEDNDKLLYAIDCYEESLKRDPTCNIAWLNLIETYLFIQEWDVAISKYGESEPYIKTRLWKFRRAWLGCLALSLAGEPIEKEDIEILNDLSTYADDNHETHSVESLFSVLEITGFDKKRLSRAKEIHNKYLQHFDI